MRNPVVDWLRQQPLLHYDPKLQIVLTHAGVPHIWTLAMARRQARRVEEVLRGSRAAVRRILPSLYGDRPRRWNACQTGIEEMRLTVNYLTRMRFCATDGELNLRASGLVPPAVRLHPGLPIRRKLGRGRSSAIGLPCRGGRASPTSGIWIMAVCGEGPRRTAPRRWQGLSGCGGREADSAEA